MYHISNVSWKPVSLILIIEFIFASQMSNLYTLISLCCFGQCLQDPEDDHGHPGNLLNLHLKSMENNVTESSPNYNILCLNCIWNAYSIFFLSFINWYDFFLQKTFVAKKEQELVSIVWVQCYPNQISQAENERDSKLEVYWLLVKIDELWFILDLLYKPFLPKREIAVL